MSRPLRVAVTGLGRVPRNLVRLLVGATDLKVVALATAARPEAVRYLLRFDTQLGRAPFPIELVDDGLVLAGEGMIRLLDDPSPGAADWRELGVDVVVECAAEQPTRVELERHLERGARRVVLCVPPAEAPDLTVVPGLNADQLRPEHRIVSNASNTAHAAGPVLAALDEAFGVEAAFLSAVHSYAEEGRVADVPAAEPRRGRAAAENIIPQTTNAAEVLVAAYPQLAGRLRAQAINVPVPDGSVADLVCWHRSPVSRDEINAALETAAAGRFAGLLGFEHEPIVSTDILRDPRSGIVDGLATMTLRESLSKVLVWFDNGWGYTHRLIDLLRRLAALGDSEG